MSVGCAAAGTHGSRLTFEDYSVAFLDSVLKRRYVSQTRGIELLSRFEPQPLGSIQIIFEPTSTITFRVAPDFATAEQRDFSTNRWLGLVPLFRGVKYRFPELSGSCRLWLDDYPDGPGLAFCGNAMSNVLIPDSTFMDTLGHGQMDERITRGEKRWVERDPRAFWRGSSLVGRSLLKTAERRDLARLRLCLKVGELNRADLFDVGMRKVSETSVDYRYSIDVDANTCGGTGLFWKLMRGSTVLKVDSEHGYRQWYYDRLVPWVHFAPVSADLSDLLTVLEWLRSEEGVGQRIAEQGSALARRLTYDFVSEETIARIAQYVSAPHPVRG